MNAYSLHYPLLHEIENRNLKVDGPLSINFLENRSLLIIKGWSLKPELRICYSVILEEIEDHLATNEGITINFEYKIFNAFTTRFLFQAIKMLNAAAAQGKHITINWMAEKYNTEIYEMGMDLQGLCDFEFHVNLANLTIAPSLN
ncbi:SiaC family regulatory phosphoprotein [Marinoscillum sp.]|uniref:SiaC family regulatory phosphoprotein n=1 Tax=Marinoscillum sp. TaxID=2024838 RepID=UPI003BABB97C